MLKSKSRMFKGLVEKIDIALSEGTNFDEIAGKLKNVHVLVLTVGVVSVAYSRVHTTPVWPAVILLLEKTRLACFRHQEGVCS